MNKRLRNLATTILTAAGLTAGALTLAPAGAASATVVNPYTGAAAETSAVCVTNSYTGSRLAKFAVGQYGFDWSALYVYNYSTGQGYWESGSYIFEGNNTFTRVVNGFTAFYVTYADRTASGQWVYSGEWVRFGNGYYCG